LQTVAFLLTSKAEPTCGSATQMRLRGRSANKGFPTTYGGVWSTHYDPVRGQRGLVLEQVERNVFDLDRPCYMGFQQQSAHGISLDPCSSIPARTSRQRRTGRYQCYRWCASP